MQTLCLNKSSLDFSPSLEPGSVTSSNSFMGTFIMLGITLLLGLKLEAQDAGFIRNVTLIPSETQMLLKCTQGWRLRVGMHLIHA